MSEATVAEVFDAVGVTEDVFVMNQPVGIDGGSIYFAPNQDFQSSLNAYDIYLADDFVLSRATAVHTINVPSDFPLNRTTLQNATMLHFFIFADRNNAPADAPTGSGDPALWELHVPPTDTAVEVCANIFERLADVSLRTDPAIGLPAGTYWLVFYPSLNSAADEGSYLFLATTTNGHPAQLMYPGNAWGLNAPTWTSILSLGVPLQDLAFTTSGHDAHTVTFLAGSGGAISGTNHQYLRDGSYGTPVEAAADPGYRFTGWTGDYAGTANPLTLTNVSSDMTVTADF